MAQVQSGSYSSQQNLISLLRTFALQLSNAWTIDNWADDSTPILEMHVGNLYVQLEGDQTDIAVHQSLGYDGSGPGSEPDDSGNGGLGTNDRQVEAIGDAGGNYWFYGPLAGSEDFLYVVLEYATGFYRHFGFGDLVKANDYTGGEFAYGGNWDQSTNFIDLATAGQHSILLDHGSSIAGQCATIHLEGLTDEPDPDTKWGIVTLLSSVGNDGNGDPRWPVIGGVRGGPMTAAFCFAKASLLDGLFPGIPIKLWARYTGATPERWRLLGTMPYARVVQMGLIDPQDTFTVGGETWRVFPAARKTYITPEGTSGTEESWNLGIAYRES